MPSIMVSDEVYRKLEAKASERHSSIEDVINPFLEQIIDTPAPAPEGGVLTGDAWWEAFEEMGREAQTRAHMYPPGYEADCSRESVLTGDAWWAAQEEMKRARAERGIEYPPGFEVDSSRETLYSGEDD